MTTTSYGVNTFFYVWAAYLNIVLTYGMETAFFRFFNKSSKKQSVVFTAFLSIVFTCLVASCSLLYFAENISRYVGFSVVWHFKILVLITIFDTLVVIPFAYLRALEQSKKYTLYRLLNVLIYAFLNLLFLKVFSEQQLRDWGLFSPQKTDYIFIANFVASLVTLAVSLRFIFSKFSLSFSHFDCSVLKKMLRYAFPVMIAGLAYATNENLDKLLLEKWLGKDSMGMYAGAYKMGVLMSLFVLAFRLGAEPFFFKNAKNKNAPKIYATVLKWFVIVGLFGMLFLVAYIQLFAKILLGDEAYYKALDIVPIILLANLFLGIYNNLSIWYKLTDKTYYGMYISIFGALLTVGLLFVGIPILGFMAAAWTTLITYITMSLLSYFLGRKKYPVPYCVKDIGFYIFWAVGLSASSYIFFKSEIVVNTLLVLAYIVMVFLREKQEILKYYNKK